MAQIVLSLIEPSSEIAIELEGLGAAARSDLEYALLLAGASITDRGYRIASFSFRKAASELAGQLRQTGAQIQWDAGVGELLTLQLEEIEARRSIEDHFEPLLHIQVDERVRASGRFVLNLKERQKDNLARLMVIPHGANFSVPGAGKTATLLALYEAFRSESRVDRLLVVAPKNAFLSWEDEVESCFQARGRPRVARLTGGRRGVVTALSSDPEIALITYQLLPNVLDIVIPWARRHNVQVVLDESHRAKAGYAGTYASAALQLAGTAVRRDILSGTPLPHAPEDLRSQLDFLWPGHRILPDMRLLSESPPEIVREVSRRVRPLYVRTTKDQLELPALNVRPVPVTLGPIQRELYDFLRSEAARIAGGMSYRDRRFFRALGRQVVRLIEAAANPMLLAQAGLFDLSEDVDGSSPRLAMASDLLREMARSEQPAKIEKAVELVQEATSQGEKVVVWSSFVLNLLTLERALSDYHPVLLFGQIPTGEDGDPDTREGRIRLFHDDPTCQVMIANPAAAGEGISLHRASHHAIYLDRNFNAAHYLQSVDRIHRLGSEQPCKVDVLEAVGTIDARIAQRLRAKIETMAQILNDDGLRALAYDPEDIVEEFEAGIELDDVEEIIDHLVAEPGQD